MNKPIIRKTVKKSVLSAIIFIWGGFVSFSNPIEPPKVISELYIVNDSTWYLELVFSDVYTSTLYFDNLSISSSSGTCSFKHGIQINHDTVIVITNDSLQTPLYLHRNGDFIRIFGSMVSDQIAFGETIDSQIAAPLPGQSIARYDYSCFDISSNDASSIMFLVKENNPSIGTHPFQPTTFMGTFTGYVFDKFHRPLSGIILGDSHYYVGAPTYYCQNYSHNISTDSTGFFSVNEYSGRRRIELFLNSTAVYGDSTIDIEPNVLNYYEFTLDSLNASIEGNIQYKKISTTCFPNPSTNGTTIAFELPARGSVQNILIKIYNGVGEIVKIIPVNPSSTSTKYSVNWDGFDDSKKVSAGIYYYAIEIDGRKTASNKIVIKQ
jgi:hypothetical protein